MIDNLPLTNQLKSLSDEESLAFGLEEVKKYSILLG
jgi:hypothetical protein